MDAATATKQAAAGLFGMVQQQATMMGICRRLLSSGHYVRRLPAAESDHEEGSQRRRRTAGDGALDKQRWHPK
jgi:hypothetical protein